MVSINDFKTLSIELDRVNSYIPPIIINEADNNGRRLKFTPTYEGQPVTGITSARMYYDPRPRDASSIGDYVDGTKDGDGWVFVIPPNTFTAGVQGIASVSFTDADGETYTRSMPIEVESGGTKIDSQGTRIDRLIATLEQMVNDFTMTADTETGPAGSQASVNVTKDGASYNLAFTIPRGPQGPKGDPGDLTTVTHDATLTGAGTASDVLKVSAGFYADAVDIGNSRKLDDLTASGVYKIMEYQGEDSPLPGFSITAIVVVTNAGSSVSQSAMVLWSDHASSAVYVRSKVAGSWLKWVEHGDFARTVSNPYKYTSGTIDLNSIFRDGAYAFGGEVKITNGPQGADYGNYIRGLLIHSNCTYQGGAGVSIQIWANRAGTVGNPFLAMRLLVAVGSWSDWEKFAFTGDLSNYVPLSTYRALETRVKALEAKLENQ